MTLRVVVDVETSGLGALDPSGPRPDGVVEVGLAWKDASENLQSCKFLCNPGEEFFADGRADEALAVNGFTLEAIRKAKPVKDVALDLLKFLRLLQKSNGEVVLYAYNAPFDMWFLSRPPWDVTDFAIGECLMQRAIRVQKFGNGHYSLKRALAYANIEFDGVSHDAEVDCRAEYRLMEWLDKTERLAADTFTAADVAEDIERYVKARQSPPPWPKEQPKSDSIRPSDVMMCLRKWWYQTHDTPDDPDYVRDFGETKGPETNDRERVAIEKFRRAGIRVVDGPFEKRVKDVGLDMTGYVDARIEWPHDSGHFFVLEVKTSAGKLDWVTAEPLEDYLVQVECYLRMSGYHDAVIDYYALNPVEIGRWKLVPYTSDDLRWSRILARLPVLRATREPSASTPDREYTEPNKYPCRVCPFHKRCWGSA